MKIHYSFYITSMVFLFVELVCMFISCVCWCDCSEIRYMSINTYKITLNVTMIYTLATWGIRKSLCLGVYRCFHLCTKCRYCTESDTVSITHRTSHTHFDVLPNDDHKTGKSFNCDLKAFYTTIHVSGLVYTTRVHEIKREREKARDRWTNEKLHVK